MTSLRLAGVVAAAAAFLVLGAACGCDPGGGDTLTKEDAEARATIDHGVFGVALWLEGNQMPGSSGGTTEPLRNRAVRIHALTHANEATTVTRDGAYGLYDSITTPLAGSSITDADGFYEVELPAGKYSVFVQDGDAWYCNSIGAAGGELCEVDVAADARVFFEVHVDYKAAY